MDIELRPLRLAEILDRIFQLYRARFTLFLGIAGVSTILGTAVEFGPIWRNSAG